jgi:hypothetical protein
MKEMGSFRGVVTLLTWHFTVCGLKCAKWETFTDSEKGKEICSKDGNSQNRLLFLFGLE